MGEQFKVPSWKMASVCTLNMQEAWGSVACTKDEKKIVLAPLWSSTIDNINHNFWRTGPLCHHISDALWREISRLEITWNNTERNIGKILKYWNHNGGFLWNSKLIYLNADKGSTLGDRQRNRDIDTDTKVLSHHKNNSFKTENI